MNAFQNSNKSYIRNEYLLKKIAFSYSGSPVLRPLWWHHPHDPDSLTTDSEYLIAGAEGSLLLIAPILDEGARTRDVYLPYGRWRDLLRGGDVIQGRTWLKNYNVKLSELPTFELVKENTGRNI